MEKQIILVKPGALKDEDKNNLREMGFVVMESEKPKDITVLHDFNGLASNIVLECALEALGWGNDNTGRLRFGDLLRQKLLAATKKKAVDSE